MSMIDGYEMDYYLDVEATLKEAPAYRKDERAADFCDRYVKWFKGERQKVLVSKPLAH